MSSYQVTFQTTGGIEHQHIQVICPLAEMLSHLCRSLCLCDITGQRKSLLTDILSLLTSAPVRIVLAPPVGSVRALEAELVAVQPG